MPLDFRTINSLWASVLVETLVRLGAPLAVISPGSRSTPLAFALAQHPQIEAIPILDERSAAFFALGVAKQRGMPVPLVCTSGTAAANYFPALIEARESRVPLLALTADRPAELRDCQSGQTIDQVKLYGSYVNWQADVALPEPELGMLAYLRQTVIYAWQRACLPVAGPVHLNLSFRDPLPPLQDPSVHARLGGLDANHFFATVAHLDQPRRHWVGGSLVEEWRRCERGVIVAGPAQPQDPRQYCEAAARLSRVLGWPLLAEGLSPLRNYADLNPYLVSTYDLVLRNPNLAQQLAPDRVIHLGPLPTSKTLRAWLQAVDPRRWVVDPADRNLDPLHGRTTHIPLSVEDLAVELLEWPTAEFNFYLNRWCQLETWARRSIDQTLGDVEFCFEGKVCWLLAQHLPVGTPIFIANSMPVRDVESFWQPGTRQLQPFFNRGANGIDGTLSTALGVAHAHRPSVLLTGDLALLHDTNGLLIRKALRGHLTIVLINNHGGGIFEMLPIAQFDPPFEEFFATPQQINFAQLCQTYGVGYERIEDWAQLIHAVDPLPSSGMRVLEIQTDRKIDAQCRKDWLERLAATLPIEK